MCDGYSRQIKSLCLWKCFHHNHYLLLFIIPAMWYVFSMHKEQADVFHVHDLLILDLRGKKERKKETIKPWRNAHWEPHWPLHTGTSMHEVSGTKAKSFWLSSPHHVRSMDQVKWPRAVPRQEELVSPSSLSQLWHSCSQHWLCWEIRVLIKCTFSWKVFSLHRNFDFLMKTKKVLA